MGVDPHTTHWQPSASIENLRARAKLIGTIRHFFSTRGVLEVETPLMCHTSVTDPFIESIPCNFLSSAHQEQHYFLQTSPEYMMKRLLAAGSGAIYQICKAFRQGEIGRFHNPEFTMLEWYRPSFDHHKLMDEMDELLRCILHCEVADRWSYHDLFQHYLNINPHLATHDELATCAQQHCLQMATEVIDKDTWLNLLITHCIEPQLGQDRPCFVYDFPTSQAALARIQPGNLPVASRFEVYYKGLELANGFHELQDADEQRKRFENNLRLREQLKLPLLAIDKYFLTALSHGLPDCAGVALGIDRLLMLITEAACIADVLSFDFSRV